MKKKIKKIPKMYSEDHVLVMFEEIKSQFMAFGEGQQILSDKVDNLETKVDKMQLDINNMQDDIIEIKHKLSEKVDREEFNKLENRVIKMERLLLAKSS